MNNDLKILGEFTNKEIKKQEGEDLIFVNSLGRRYKQHIAGMFSSDTGKIIIAKRYLKLYAEWHLTEEFILTEWHENIHKAIFNCIGEGHSKKGEEDIVELIIELSIEDDISEKMRLYEKSHADFKCRRKNKNGKQFKRT